MLVYLITLQVKIKLITTNTLSDLVSYFSSLCFLRFSLMLEQAFNFKKFSEKLFTSGMPSKEQLKDIVNFNIQIVINLAPHTVRDAVKDEENIVKSLNIEYINIPVDWNSPTKENLVKFMDLMDKNIDKTVYVHCQANFRASSFVTIYRILRQHWNQEEALKTMYEIWSVNAYPIWQEFIAEFVDKEK